MTGAGSGPLTAVAVFCGSSFGIDPAYRRSAETVGRLLAGRGLTLIYGGGHVGLMGATADAALAAGGRVVGVIPRQLHDRELTHTGLTELRVVPSMHDRKAVMADLADAFLVLPGGAGTLEEAAEQWTWAQLNLHRKPTGFLDVGGFWAPLRAMRDRMVSDGFVRPDQAGIISFSDDPEQLLDRLSRPADWPDKWGTPR